MSDPLKEAMAVLDALRRRGTRVILTTHLNLIKGYAALREGVENAAVEFDEATLAPTYRLHYGIPGASSAFAIARSLGLPEEVLAAAPDHQTAPVQDAEERARAEPRAPCPPPVPGPRSAPIRVTGPASRAAARRCRDARRSRVLHAQKIHLRGCPGSAHG